MDPIINGDVTPTLPRNLLERLLRLLTPSQIKMFVEHCEEVDCHGHGFIQVTWRDGKPDVISHQASDKA